MHPIRRTSVIAVLALAGYALPAGANTILYATGPVNPTGTSSGWVNAEVSFEIDHLTDTVLISVANLQADPISVGQLISRVSFTLSHFTSTAPNAHVATGRATRFEIDRMGRIQEVEEPLKTDWQILPIATGGFDLCTICDGSGRPDELLIGAPAGNGRYTSANGSIAGNKPHNPFLLASGQAYSDGPFAGATSTPTWAVSISGIQPTSAIGSVTVGFGTSYGSLVAPAYEATEIPEPGTAVLLGCGVALIAVAQWHKKKGQAA